MKSKILSGLIVVSVIAGLSPKANAVAFGFISAGGSEDPNAQSNMATSAVVTADLRDHRALGIYLLGKPSEATTQLTYQIQAYGAEYEEAKNLASVIVNAQLTESNSGKQSLITPFEVNLAAPSFAKSDGFTHMLRDIKQQQPQVDYNPTPSDISANFSLQGQLPANRGWRPEFCKKQKLNEESGSAEANSKFPYSLDCGTDAAILGATAGVFLVGPIIQRSGQYQMSSNLSTINVLDRGFAGTNRPNLNKAADYLDAAILLAVPGILLMDKDMKGVDTTVMYVEALALETSLYKLAVNSVSRPRPNTYDQSGQFPVDSTANQSFLSGHAASAFTSACFFSEVYSNVHPEANRLMVWGLPALAAAVVGGLRIEGGKHFPTDVLAGAAMGCYVGKKVPQLHMNDDENPRKLTIKVTPLIGVDFQGAKIIGKF